MTDPRLFNHPVVRAEAERLARDLHNAMFPGRTCSPPEEYGFLALLSDPSRPEARDWMVRSGDARARASGGDPCFAEFRDDSDALVREWLEVHRD